MAGKQLNELPRLGAVSDSALLLAQQDGATGATTAAQLASYVLMDANIVGVTAIAVTEAVDGTVTMINTLESGNMEAIIISPDENGNPSKLTYNGKEIPISWAVSE